MRLLKHLPGSGFELITFNNDDPPPYAILSHTWTEGQEVTYNELVAGTGKDKTGYVKICFCSERAAADGLEYFWVDTCCIDKSTSDELGTAINSMFRWYQRASKCYVYLSDVSVPDEITNAEAFRIEWQAAFQQSRWFMRGWTLQELLPPASVEFFCKQGKRLGSRMSLEQDIHEITKIPIGALRGQSLSRFSVEDRMSWAARRTTTLKEDKVYCLLGIFGVFLSLIYGEGETYATLRLREEIQKRQEGRGTDSSRDLSVLSSLPFPRNELFVGRADELRSLEQHLLISDTHRRMTIHGLGGCGKSALAVEFAYRALVTHARLVFWVPAISQESFELAYREIGVCLRIPGITDDNADIKKLVQKMLSSKSVDDWLMIVDNADDYEVLLGTTDSHSKPARLHDYLPRNDRGAIIFTTRSRKVAGALTPSSVLRLNDMSKAEARQLLTRRITQQALLDDETAVDELLETLTCLPLAIVQAAAFINNNDVSVSGYISLFRHAGAETELFNQHFDDPSRYEELDSTIAKTWHVSFDQIRRQDRLAAEYLSFMTCIDRVNIPQSLLPPGDSLVQQTKALGTLTGYAFITERLQTVQESDGDRFFDMHRLVHMASVWWLDRHDERAAWVDTAVARLQDLVPYGGHEHKEVWTTYLPHAIHVAGTHGIVGKAASASLLDRVGRCQASLGHYSAAEITHQQVLSMIENALGPEHPHTLTSMNNVALALNGQGKYAEAETMHRETLRLSKKVSGDEHPDTLKSMNNVAQALSNQGKYADAEEMHRETLRLNKKVSGDEHPDTLTSMNNIALALSDQGKYAEAETMHRETLRLRNKVSGDEHPHTLTSMDNIALALSGQGKYAEAEEMHRETLRLRKKVLGDEHPDTLTSMNNIALALNGQGKYAEAEEMHRETLRLSKKVSGDEHPHTLASMNNIAHALSDQGKYAEAEKMHRETLRLRNKVSGEEHPDTLTSMNNVALALSDQGKYAEAEKMHRETLRLSRKVLGDEHPDTLTNLTLFWKARK
ncbi:kinesin light chain 1 [Macroventuria anomochaeta]|uniref:Kinesin light chain 1 n=1 Tax=Macroventuria anomochaeta TaxID=301207 RepID=A0ACB6S3X2_9PLEO|nr:kinesin light chain 1 [Macroventuria anomochaeta]KAF2628861.1 kinesin light chain 1 [Macroventuria anomochaeta]